jgi:hypothetical protein
MKPRALLAACAMCLFAPLAAAAPVESGPVGRIYHYLRSNIDGSEPEHIYVFRQGEARLEVYKMVENCTNAALVTADLDIEGGFAPRLIGGRLKPNAEHSEFAFLTYDAPTRLLDMRVVLPEGELREQAPVTAPFHVFDFDLADLTVFAPGRAKQRQDFAVDLVLLWPPGKDGKKLLALGRAEFKFVREEKHGSHAALRYEVGGPAFDENGGPIWFDTNEGHIVDAEWKIPNHAEYKDFKLKLVGVEDSNASHWKQLLTLHFLGCENG